MCWVYVKYNSKVIREVLEDTYTGNQKEVVIALFDLLSTIQNFNYTINSNAK